MALNHKKIQTKTILMCHFSTFRVEKFKFDDIIFYEVV